VQSLNLRCTDLRQNDSCENNHFVQRLNLISVPVRQAGKAADDDGKKFDRVTGYAKEGAHPIKLSHEK
jgi:hypothetical protein